MTCGQLGATREGLAKSGELEGEGGPRGPLITTGSGRDRAHLPTSNTIPAPTGHTLDVRGERAHLQPMEFFMANHTPVFLRSLLYPQSWLWGRLTPPLRSGQSAPVEAALAAVIGLGEAFNSELINLSPRTLAGISGTTCLPSTGATELQ